MKDRRELNAAVKIDQMVRDEELKRVMKEAITEWLDAKFLLFGKWTLGGFAAAAVAAVCYMILAANGWHK